MQEVGESKSKTARSRRVQEVGRASLKQQEAAWYAGKWVEDSNKPSDMCDDMKSSKSRKLLTRYLITGEVSADK